jgi:ABC-type lipoprotein export system ATPase subunit
MVTHENDIAEYARRQIVMRDGLVHRESINEHPVELSTPVTPA